MIYQIGKECVKHSEICQKLNYNLTRIVSQVKLLSHKAETAAKMPNESAH